MPTLEQQINILEQEKKDLLNERDTVEATIREEFATKIDNLEQGVRDGYAAAVGLLASLRTYDLPAPVAKLIDIAARKVAGWVREEIPYMSETYKDVLEEQVIKAESGRTLSPVYFKELYPEAYEKDRLLNLHKTHKWSDLTSEDRKAVRRLLVNSTEFPNRQDFLDFKRAFGAAADRGAR